MEHKSKPRVFIGSSSEGKMLAKHLKKELLVSFEPRVWYKGIFSLSESTLEGLITASKNFDFAVLIVTPDDLVIKRKRRHIVPRDNIIFEIGLFMGSLGRKRTFMVLCREDKVELPTDLAGITVATYSRRVKNSPSIAMHTLALKIKKTADEVIDKEGIKTQNSQSFSLLSKTALKWLNISEPVRKKLIQSEYIEIGKAGEVLLKFIQAAKPESSTLLAICGYKGNYSDTYYKKNFKRCKAVKRIFSYEAIREEIKAKGNSEALKGIKLHLDRTAHNNCRVKAFLIPNTTSIDLLTSHTFHPPFSFGLAILLNGRTPKKAVVHWEVDAEPLRDLLGIEGFIINEDQKELLRELLALHKKIAESNPVLKSDTEINIAIKKLEDWKLDYLKKQSEEK